MFGSHSEGIQVCLCLILLLCVLIPSFIDYQHQTWRNTIVYNSLKFHSSKNVRFLSILHHIRLKELVSSPSLYIDNLSSKEEEFRGLQVLQDLSALEDFPEASLP